MRVGINISPLKSGHAGRGTGTYTRSLIEALKRNKNNIEVIEFSNPTELNSKIDVIHYPFFDPFLLTLPRKRANPTVVTIHDVIPIVYSAHFPRGIKGELIWQMQKHIVTTVDAIITDSEASKNDIIRIFRIQPERISVIYLAAGTEFIPQPIVEQERIRKKYSLPKKFILYVGDVNWNKNVPGLIRAVQSVRVPLVLVGKVFLDKTLEEVREINTLIQKFNLEDLIHKLGYVEGSDLPALYSAASLYIQPSFAEGFGLPVIEAMACGTPAVVSSKTSLSEISGPSILVEPESPDSIAKGIALGLSEGKVHQHDACIAWAKTFSWEKTAEETSGIYSSILNL